MSYVVTRKDNEKGQLFNFRPLIDYRTQSENITRRKKTVDVKLVFTFTGQYTICLNQCNRENSLNNLSSNF